MRGDVTLMRRAEKFAALDLSSAFSRHSTAYKFSTGTPRGPYCQQPGKAPSCPEAAYEILNDAIGLPLPFEASAACGQRGDDPTFAIIQPMAAKPILQNSNASHHG
jgi:hypothetical protein